MRPYNVEIFTQDFEMVGNTNVNEITYKEDYLSSDGNTVTVLALPGIKKQDYIRISRGDEEYAGIVTEIGYGTDKSNKLQTISYKPLMELLNTDVLFDVDLQGQGSMEQFICDRIREMFITNEDGMQNIKGLSVSAVTATKDWSLHITPSDKGGHYNIVNLIDSVIIPAMEKYSILVKTKLDIQNREVQITVGKAAAGVITIESDLPNIIKKSVTIRQVSADVNKLVIYDSSDYETKRVYYLHPDLGYDTKDRDRIVPVVCEMQSVSHEETGTCHLHRIFRRIGRADKSVPHAESRERRRRGRRGNPHPCHFLCRRGCGDRSGRSGVGDTGLHTGRNHGRLRAFRVFEDHQSGG